MAIIRVESGGRLEGTVKIPGDKSISHRAAMLAALAEGRSVIENYSNGADCHSTLECLRSLGVSWKFNEDNEALTIEGTGLDGLTEPVDVMSADNSGTTLRLLCGLLAGQNFFSVLTGDSSLRIRPMMRIVEPLRQMGAVIHGRNNGHKAPLAIVGQPLMPIEYFTPVASAQIKSALLLAACFTEGVTTIHEPHQSRDHTERMLAWMGADIQQEGKTVRLQGRPRLQAKHFTIPGDLSAAAFYLAAAGLVPDSEVRIKAVGVNPTRTGLLDVLDQMGMRITFSNHRQECGEPVADLVGQYSPFTASEIGGEMVPRCIDEIPVLAVLATQAKGRTVIRDAEELRVKETDRLAAITKELRKLGAKIEEMKDGLIIDGPTQLHGGTVHTYGDHRLAMALAVAALAADSPVDIVDAEVAGISDPHFYNQLSLLGARCATLDGGVDDE